MSVTRRLTTTRTAYPVCRWHFCDTERYDQKGSFEFRSGYPSRPNEHGIVVNRRDISATWRESRPTRASAEIHPGWSTITNRFSIQ